MVARKGVEKKRMTIALFPCTYIIFCRYAKDRLWSESYAASWIVEKFVKDNLPFLKRRKKTC